MAFCSPKLQILSVDLWRGGDGGEAKRLKGLFAPPLPLFKIISMAFDGGGTLQPVIVSVAVWCERNEGVQSC